MKYALGFALAALVVMAALIGLAWYHGEISERIRRAVRGTGY